MVAAKSTLIFRADAYAKIGSGHLMRSLALSQSWKSSGGEVVFVTNCESLLMQERLKREGFDVFPIENSYPHPEDLKKTLELLKDYSDSWCVIDGYNFDTDYQNAIRCNGNQVLVVDDTAHLEFYNADAILNQNINAQELKYNSLPNTSLLLGTQYTLLRQEFLKYQNFERVIRQNADRVLITMGGGDFNNQTLKTLLALEQTQVSNLEIKAVIGVNNPYLPELGKAAAKLRFPLELICGSENMAGLMMWADIAISASGSTCWELAFMQLPSLLLITADNQRAIANGLEQSGFAVNIGWYENVSEKDLIAKVEEVLSDKLLRKKMSESGIRIVDGYGSRRVVNFLRSMTVRSS